MRNCLALPSAAPRNPVSFRSLLDIGACGAEQVRKKLLGAPLGNGEVVDTWGIGLGERLDVLGTLFGAHTPGLLHEIGQPPLQHYLSQCLAPDVSEGRVDKDFADEPRLVEMLALVLQAACARFTICSRAAVCACQMSRIATPSASDGSSAMPICLISYR